MIDSALAAKISIDDHDSLVLGRRPDEDDDWILMDDGLGLGFGGPGRLSIDWRNSLTTGVTGFQF